MGDKSTESEEKILDGGEWNATAAFCKFLCEKKWGYACELFCMRWSQWAKYHIITFLRTRLNAFCRTFTGGSSVKGAAIAR